MIIKSIFDTSYFLEIAHTKLANLKRYKGKAFLLVEEESIFCFFRRVYISPIVHIACKAGKQLFSQRTTP